ncbi:MAG TPA: branched-chain amino acid ABC transporter permease [Chloroflexota bacterium]|nr:branched-chain amino acid ABC transporter permease [Chloroflexota bacterium]
MAALSLARRRPRNLLGGEWRDNPWVRRAVVALVVLLAFLYPILDHSDPRVDTAYVAEIYILLALGLNIVVGFAGLLDLGYAAFFAIGAYTAAMLASTHFSVGKSTISNLLFTIGPGGIHLNFFVLIPCAALVAAFFGLLFGAPTLRLRGDYLAIVTLGFGEIVPKVVENLGGGSGLFLGRFVCHGALHHRHCANGIGIPDLTGGINNITGIDAPPNVNLLWIHWSWQTNNPRPWYYLGFVIIAISVIIITRLRDSRLGRCWVAIREDEVAAAHAGVNITGTRLTAFALGAAFSGFGGLLYASQLGTVSYDQFFFSVSVSILVMVILGGIGSIPGVMVGGVVIAYLSQTWLDTISAKLNTLGSNIHHAPGPIGAFGTWLATAPISTAKPLILGLILVGMMLLRPQGLIPNRRRARELHPETASEAAEENEELWTVQTGEI